jgi:hypothetical protein
MAHKGLLLQPLPVRVRVRALLFSFRRTPDFPNEPHFFYPGKIGAIHHT